MTSTLSYTLTDSATMLRRNLKHQLRYPSLTLMLAGLPILFLLLFVYVFGGQLGAGLGAVGTHPDRHAYLTYIVPGILIMTVASAALGTAISIAMDMTEGIIDRFRTMAIARACRADRPRARQRHPDPGSAGASSSACRLAIGFRPSRPARLAGRAGVLALFAFALIWLATALGLAAKSVETASNTPMFLTLLPFLSSGVRADRALPAGLRQFADYQPFTPVIRDHARPAHRRPDRCPRRRGGRLERCHRAGLLPVVDPPLRPAPGSRPEIADIALRDL